MKGVGSLLGTSFLRLPPKGPLALYAMGARTCGLAKGDSRGGSRCLTDPCTEQAKAGSQARKRSNV